MNEISALHACTKCHGEDVWGDKVSLCGPGGLEFSILLSLPPKCWDYRVHRHIQLNFLFTFLPFYENPWSWGHVSGLSKELGEVHRHVCHPALSVFQILLLLLPVPCPCLFCSSQQGVLRCHLIHTQVTAFSCLSPGLADCCSLLLTRKSWKNVGSVF